MFGKKNGQGELFYSNGNCFVGRFKANLFDGYGRFEYINGSFYEGNFFKGKRHGKGIFKNQEGIVKDGLWENNIFIA